MKKKIAKKIRKDVESMAVNATPEQKRKAYQRFKNIYKSLNK